MKQRNGLLFVLFASLPACQMAPPHRPVQIHGERSGKDLRESWDAERKHEAAHFTDADLQRMVGQLFVESDPNRANFHGLLYSGKRAVPYLIQALDESRTATAVFTSDVFRIDGVSPFHRICSLLAESAPPEAVKSLARYVTHPDPRFRQEAASVLAQIGTAECVAPVTKALTDHEDVRDFVLIGMMNGIKDGRGDPAFLQAMFRPVAALLNDAPGHRVTGPAEVLVAIDPNKALSILQSPRYFSTSNPQLREVLVALNRDNLQVSHALLLPLLGELEPLAAKEKTREWDYAGALILYARNPDDGAQCRLEALLNSPSSRIASAAAQGLQILAGIDPHEVVWGVYEERGFAAMTKPQQYYHAIEDYRDEVDNGGHNQYFENSASDLNATALEGLRVIGAKEKESILWNASMAFGPLGPPRDREKRQHAMDFFGGIQDGIFKIADSKFFASEERPGQRLDVLLTQYALKHKSDFTNEH